MQSCHAINWFLHRTKVVSPSTLQWRKDEKWGHNHIRYYCQSSELKNITDQVEKDVRYSSCISKKLFLWQNRFYTSTVLKITFSNIQISSSTTIFSSLKRFSESEHHIHILVVSLDIAYALWCSFQLHIRQQYTSNLWQ